MPSSSCVAPPCKVPIPSSSCMAPSCNASTPSSSCAAPPCKMFAPSLSCVAPSFKALAPSSSCATPSFNSGTLSCKAETPSASCFVPSSNWFPAVVNVSTLSVTLSRFSSSRFAAVKALLVATDIVISSSKSFTSAVTSKYCGISTSANLPSKLKFKLSFNPGIVMPTTIFPLSDSIIFPLVTSILLNLSEDKIIPVIIVNGTYASFVLPFTTICFLRLLV